jgi:phage N-6-adenine-methyltransferase
MSAGCTDPPQKGGRSDLVPFDPKTAAVNDAQADALIDYAKRVKNWPTLEIAIAAKIEDQAEFVRWWRATVRGDGRPGNGPRSATVLSCEDAEKLTGITKQQVSRWGVALKDREAYRIKLYGRAYRVAMAGEPEAFRTYFTGNNEWFTPPECLDLAREVMGGIDLDPASHPLAQERVQAAQFFSKDNDGLNRKWRGRVWMNPPYSQPEIEQFIEKLICEVSAGHVVEAIVLTNNSTDTTWFQKAALWANAICFTRGRIRFIAPD